MPIHIHQQGKLFHLTNQKISYIMQVLEDGSLGNLYFGKKVADRTDFSHLIESAYRPNTTYAPTLIHISEPTRPLYIRYAVFYLKKKNYQQYCTYGYGLPYTTH